MTARQFDRDQSSRADVRALADQAFSRASGAHLREGNCVRLLKDATENYPAWLDAIAAARETIHVDMYIVHEDGEGRRFADALLAKARDGVRVRVIYDWLGGFRNASRTFWNQLRAGGVEVRCYNAPRFDQPLGWLSRDHRKLISVDRTIGFVTGLCIGDAWVGHPARGLEPWRDTGVEVRGPAVADIEDAFADAWAATGAPLNEKTATIGKCIDTVPAGFLSDVGMRIVATIPDTASVFRLDLLVAALARETLWLTDAYYSGTAPYVEALRAAARDGVDVRLLVPGTSDVPIVLPFSRAGYRPLLQAGVRVFEWNGPMLHSKTAVADGRWARVGSTNLNVTSWMGNRELDAMIEDVRFARQMESMYEDDLGRATEIVLEGNRVRSAARRHRTRARPSVPGSSGRALAGALRIGNTVSAAVTNRRLLAPIEAHIALIAGAMFLAISALAAYYPRGFAYPFAALAAWIATALLLRGYRLTRARRRRQT